LVYGWRRVDRGQLPDALEYGALCQPISDDADVDELFSTYDSELRDVADRFTPQHAVRYTALGRRRACAVV